MTQCTDLQQSGRNYTVKSDEVILHIKKKMTK